MSEHWKPIPGYEGLYEVSDLGRVRSLDRITTDKHGCKAVRSGRVLKPAPVQKGYLQVVLCRDGKMSPQRVHTLVAQAFHGPRPDGCEVAHDDGDKLNNTALNLVYKTPKANCADKLRHGTAQKGERAGRRKLDAIDVLTILTVADDHSAEEIATEFGITSRHVYDITSGKSWSCLFE
jgi:hypothetical protein